MEKQKAQDLIRNGATVTMAALAGLSSYAILKGTTLRPLSVAGFTLDSVIATGCTTHYLVSHLQGRNKPHAHQADAEHCDQAEGPFTDQEIAIKAARDQISR